MNLFGSSPLAEKLIRMGERAEQARDEDSEKISKLQDLVKQLPETSQKDLKIVLDLLARVAKNEHVNKMGVTNLGTMIGPRLVALMIPSKWLWQ